MQGGIHRKIVLFWGVDDHKLIYWVAKEEDAARESRYCQDFKKEEIRMRLVEDGEFFIV